ncbi:MAG TPA: hypothetical protein VFF30_08195 [Nitrososphaerales archaeon]|nr:hypothetical protein [Nitrososphaerales archaeon]
MIVTNPAHMPYRNHYIPYSYATSSPNINITESGPEVHAYSQGSYVVSDQTTSTNSNDIFIQLYGFAANPLFNNSPNYDYYIFDIYESATAASGSGWSVDSGGHASPNGDTINVTVSVCNSPGEQILQGNISPNSPQDPTADNTPQSTSVDLSYSGFSIGISHTFTAPKSQTDNESPTDYCHVSWYSSDNEGDSPAGVSGYLYDFAFGLQVPKGQPAAIGGLAFGNFYKCTFWLLNSCLSHLSDHPSLSFSSSFTTPPLTNVTSSPSGPGFVQVDGQSVSTPQPYVWDEGNSHTITASTYVNQGIGKRFLFSSWSDGGSISHNIQAPTSPTTFIAYFYEQDELNISQSSFGTTDPPPSPTPYWYNSTQTATVKAIPSSGYALSGWTLDGQSYGNANPITIPMSSPHTLVANFVQEPSLVVSAGLGGTVSVQSSAINNGAPQTISAGSSETYVVPSGSQVTLTANPTNSYLFGNWTGTQFSNANPMLVTVTSNMQESANFAQPMTTVVFSVNGLGSSASGVFLTVDGSSYSMSALPKKFSWLVGSTHSFAWSQNVTGSPGIRYVWESTSGFTNAESGTIIVPAGGGTIVSNWNTEYLLTFSTTGLDNSAAGVILIVNGQDYSYTQLPLQLWATSGSSISFGYQTSISSGSSGEKFTLNIVSVSSPFSVSGPANILASYTQSDHNTISQPNASNNPPVTSSSSSSSLVPTTTASVSTAYPRSNASRAIDTTTILAGAAIASVAIGLIAGFFLRRPR